MLLSLKNNFNNSVSLFNKEGLGKILLDKSPSIPLFQRGRWTLTNNSSASLSRTGFWLFNDDYLVTVLERDGACNPVTHAFKAINAFKRFSQIYKPRQASADLICKSVAVYLLSTTFENKH